MKKLLFLLLLLGFYQVHGQTPRKMKKEITEAFIKSRKSGRSISSWYTCNDDSAYYKKGILKIYNHANYIYDPQKCCRFIEWEFYNRSNFRLTGSDICNEPGIKHFPVGNYYKVKFKAKENTLFLTIIDYDGRKRRFEVTQFTKEPLWNKSDSAYVLTLKRIRRSSPTTGF